MLMLRKMMGCMLGAVMCFSCTREVLDVKVTDEVISSDYIGNGAEWDPYDEAVSWGFDVSEEDWRMLTSRIDVMGMGYVRCMINSRFLYWDAARGGNIYVIVISAGWRRCSGIVRITELPSCTENSIRLSPT